MRVCLFVPRASVAAYTLLTPPSTHVDDVAPGVARRQHKPTDKGGSELS